MSALYADRTVDTPAIDVGMTAPDILEGAAEVLAVHKWGRGHYQAGDNYCALGAMRAALPADYRHASVSLLAGAAPEFQRAMDSLARHVDCWWIPSWNDDIAKDADEVIEALRQTAKGLRNEEVPS
jgi:hypothetical protein